VREPAGGFCPLRQLHDFVFIVADVQSGSLRVRRTTQGVRIFLSESDVRRQQLRLVR
jgi:hypothetical protein